MTHNLSFYITLNVDHLIIDIKIADNTILKMQGIGTIVIYILFKNKHMLIKLSNIYYLLKLDANLISLRVFEEKEYEFHTMNSLLQIKDKKNVIVLEDNQG